MLVNPWRRRCKYAAILLLALMLLTPFTIDAAGQGGDENAVCLGCHSNPSLEMELPSGEKLSLYVDPEVFGSSVHGRLKQKCTACHENISGYPHPPLFAVDRRDLSIGLYTVCRQCHEKQYRDTLDSVHARLLAGGDRNAPVCTDCHGYHDVTPPDEPRSKIAQTCSKCHSIIYNQYKESVHGAALMEERNPDVPTCVDCHGVHHMDDPRTAEFRLKSPQICANCHTDPERMDKYGISTDVLDTYVADFHGTTVELFVKQAPDHPTNKAVCYDCHGIHDIKKVTDPEATVVKENLLRTCRQCHPDATANFPTAWVGHYRASPDRYPLVYYVNLFYNILIPSLIGFFLIYILLDATHRILKRFARRGA
ncbi:MAG: cytochrome C [Chloroflexi bacterium]|nr:cytochrome C [Chloroflexota bacterium]